MQDNERLVRQYFDKSGIYYDSSNNFLNVAVTTENVGDFRITLDFDENGHPLYQAYTWGMRDLCFKGKEYAGLRVCNRMNSKKMGVAFFLDSDGEVACQARGFSPMLSENDCGQVCYYLVSTVKMAFNTAYPIFKEALLDS